MRNELVFSFPFIAPPAALLSTSTSTTTHHHHHHFREFSLLGMHVKKSFIVVSLSLSLSLVYSKMREGIVLNYCDASLFLGGREHIYVLLTIVLLPYYILCFSRNAARLQH